MLNDKLFDKLNNNQKEAVLSTEGYVRVIARAGSGKTHALTHRYAYMVNEVGISPSNNIYEELDIKMDTATFQYMSDQIMGYKNPGNYVEQIADPLSDISKFEPKNINEKIILNYIQRQKKYFALDFFDLINFTIYVFKNHADILEKWQKRLHYVMIDEFQDITLKEAILLQKLVKIGL